jgi:hypothetical protein
LFIFFSENESSFKIKFLDDKMTLTIFTSRTKRYKALLEIKMIQQKPYAISCDRNSEPILEAFKILLKNKAALLEIGAGTGQHAIFMAPYFPALIWTFADRLENHPGIKTWLNDYPRINIRGPFEYEVGKNQLPQDKFDAFFASNVLHIISWEECLILFDELKNLPPKCIVMFYGAFNYNDNYSSESNKKFDAWLKNQNSKSGIRNFESVVSELKLRSISLIEDQEMPSNNRLLVFEVN